MIKKEIKKVVPTQTRRSIVENLEEIQNQLRLSAKSVAQNLKMKSWEAELLRAEDFPVFSISPDLLQKGLKEGYPEGNFVYNGDWDTEGTAPITENRSFIYETVNDMFLHNKSHRETPQYDVMKKAIDAYKRGEVEDPISLGAYWCKSYEDIDEYFAKLTRAYESIKTKGYMKQSEVQKEKPNDVKKAQDEIQTLLDRDGKIVLGRGGTHRTFIAKLLKVEKVYVILRGVHKEFVDYLIATKPADMSLSSAIEEHMKALETNR